MKFFKRKPQSPAITRTEALACIPSHSEAVNWNKTEDGEVIIEYRLNLKPFFLEMARKFTNQQAQELTKKLQLDAMGSDVWLMIDGQRDVKSIVSAVAAKSGLTVQEAEIAVTTFFRDLGRRGLINLTPKL